MTGPHNFFDDFDFLWDEDEEDQFAKVWPHPEPRQRLHELAKERIKRKEWRTRDGRNIPYSELKNKHIVNILLFLRKKAQAAAEAEASTLGLQVFGDGWKIATPDSWEGLMQELRSRNDRCDAIADLIEECDSLQKEEIIRKSVERY